MDINPASPNYNKHIQTIQVSDAPKGLGKMAINSNGTQLFVAAPNSSGAGKGQILVFNINPGDRPSNPTSNPRNWHQQIGKIEAGLGLAGISATPDPRKMLFTNRNEDVRGFGVLSIISDDPANFAATVKYVQLTLGSIFDYFDINEAVAVTLTRDKKYAFVAARNGRLIGSGIESIDSPKAGSNIGIIKDPLGDNPKLVAATRPIPGGLTSDLGLSSNDKYLYATYPGIKSTFGFDVEEIIKTVEQTNLDVLASTPIDDINPAINMASDFQILSEDSSNGRVRVEFGVPPESNRGPLAHGEIPFSVAMASKNQLVKIVSPDNSKEDRLKPTFQWEIYKPADDCEGDVCIPEVEEPQKIKKVKLYVSVFDKNNGLLPDEWRPDNGQAGVDYNPNRILTATWENNKWTWSNGERSTNNYKEFTLPDDRSLTAGQKYHWAVEVETENGKDTVTSEFDTNISPASNSQTFSSVTILTRGVEPVPENSRDSELIEGQIDAIAVQIEEAGGNVMKYNPRSGDWESVTYDKTVKDWVASNNQPNYGKPLVLLADWIKEIDPIKLYNAGFAEAAADTLFASLVQLDQKRGGTVGAGSSLYDNKGNLIRTQGSVFNSPLHFIGFGQGAVVNSEIIQRLGTFFPNAGGIPNPDGLPNPNRDIQMTTVDPHDYDLNSPEGSFRNILDPYVWVWKNVTYADNYYQTVGMGKTLNGKELSGQVNTKKWTADWNVELDNTNFNRAGFASNDDDGKGRTHRATVALYAGTANLNESQIPPENGETVYRRLGDLYENNRTNKKAWYTPSFIGTSFRFGAENAPWEGIGTGWFYSGAGGGSQLRPYLVDGSKKSKGELGNFEDYLNNYRVPVSEDNTNKDTNVGIRLGGDYAVPTLFNGNFDAISFKKEDHFIPGWYFNDNTNINRLTQTYLEDVTRIPGTIKYPNNIPNYALKLGGNQRQAIHNAFLLPDWGNLRFDVFSPINGQETGTLNVRLETMTGELITEEVINLEPARSELSYLDNITRLGVGNGSAFETFQLNLQGEGEEYNRIKANRGKPVILKFSLEGNRSVSLDNIFFKSEHLKWGNPTIARWDGSEPDNNPYKKNLLLEKPQYVVSYNADTRLPNWVSWKVDNSWRKEVIESPEAEFIVDPQLPNGWPNIDGTMYTKSALDRGHLIPVQDRNRHLKDQLATFLGTNLIPQAVDNNELFRSLEPIYIPGEPEPKYPINVNISPVWSKIESNLVPNHVFEKDKQLYITAGVFNIDQSNWQTYNGYPETNAPEKIAEFERNNRSIRQVNTSLLSNNEIRIPSWTWKTILVLDKPGLLPENILGSYTYLTPNVPEPHNTIWPENGIEHPFNTIPILGENRDNIKNAAEWRTPQKWRINLNQLQLLLNSQPEVNFRYNFLSNVPESRRTNLMNDVDFRLSI